MSISESQDFETRHWPTEIHVAPDKRTLTIAFDTGERVDITAQLLRVESPSAEVQGHGAGGKTLVLGKRDIQIAKVEPVGNYAIRIGFDDGHDTGLYTWRYLYKLGTEGEQLMTAYEAAAQAGAPKRP